MGTLGWQKQVDPCEFAPALFTQSSRTARATQEAQGDSALLKEKKDSVDKTSEGKKELALSLKRLTLETTRKKEGTKLSSDHIPAWWHMNTHPNK